MSDKWTMEIVVRSRYGQEYHAVSDLPSDILREIHKISSPSKMYPSTANFEDVCVAIKRKEFRKDLFMNEATKLGEYLAQLMTDTEGWHDTSRIEPSKRILKGF